MGEHISYMTIPKILHQIWIGPKPAPTNLMRTWKEAHPDFDYILWNEEEIVKRNLLSVCQKQIADIVEINGKADIIRWEILYQYGGYFVDADSICISPFDDVFENCSGFASFENETMRQGLVATGTMGFVPRHPLCRDIIKWISTTTEAQELIKTTRAWYSVGPGLLTKMLETGKYADMTIFPSHYFLPIHFTGGDQYTGHKKVYAYQEWGTAKQSYDTMNSVVLPDILKEPELREWYSVIITSYNTPQKYVRECLESIKCQQGYFGIEIVWVDDGSIKEASKQIISELIRFKKTSRFTKFVYLKNDTNMGTAKSSNKGLLACSSEIVFKMDSDDIMLPNRMLTQIEFMKANPGVMLCGANIRMFFTDEAGNKQVVDETNHPYKITWTELYEKRPSWYFNNPTMCYRKSAVLSVGAYNEGDSRTLYIHEDYDLLARVIKKYNQVITLPDRLHMYRLHPNQLTHGLQTNSEENIQLRNNIIERADVII
jgi:GT2 family glycosyltransferase